MLPPDLWVDGVCVDENYVAFTITNNGGTMPEPFYYEINDVYGNIIAADWLQLYSGESIVVEVSAVNAPVTINIHNWTYYATSACASTTPEVEQPDLWVDGVCLDGGSVAFTITNNGSDMLDPVYYEISDMYGGIIYQDWLQLFSGESITLELGMIPGPVTINIDNWTYYTTVECISTTPEVEQPDLWVDGVCLDGGSVAFIITNNGSDMLNPVYYEIYDMYGGVIYQDWVQLFSGESITLELGMIPGPVTINIDNWTYYTTVECISVTPEVEQPDLWADAYCTDVGGVVFVITNNGGDMADPEYYTVTDMNGVVIYQDWVQLFSGESITVEVGMVSGPVYLDVGNGLAYTSIECYVPTPEPTPTEEVTPEPTPTEEVTPEPIPTEEVTPEPTPTEEVTPEPTPTLVPPVLGCQKNNPARLDCSSLEVTATCEGGVAVFTIRNTGEPGNGDMLAPTEYRLYVGNTLVESGSVQIDGGTTMQVRYDGGGRVRLEADQQVGHPGNSRPRETITCR